MLVKIKPECFVISTVILGKKNYMYDIIPTGKKATPLFKQDIKEAVAFATKEDAQSRIIRLNNPYANVFRIERVALPENAYGNKKEDISLAEFRSRHDDKLF